MVGSVRWSSQLGNAEMRSRSTLDAISNAACLTLEQSVLLFACQACLNVADVAGIESGMSVLVKVLWSWIPIGKIRRLQVSLAGRVLQVQTQRAASKLLKAR